MFLAAEPVVTEKSLVFLSQWQFWLAVANFIGVIIIFLFNKFSHDKVVGNELKHIATDIKSVMGKQDSQGRKIIDMSNDISYLKGTLNIPLSKRTKAKQLKESEAQIEAEHELESEKQSNDNQ